MKHDLLTHEMTALYTHFGPTQGRSSFHIHVCTRPECSDVVLVGDGTSCAGKDAPHHFEVWNEKAERWEPVARAKEQP